MVDAGAATVSNRAPVDTKRTLEALVAPHIDSFDFCITRGLAEAVRNIDAVELTHPGNQARLRIWLENIKVLKPSTESQAAHDPRIFPSQCRESNSTYRGSMSVEVCMEVNEGQIVRVNTPMGKLPIMVKSKLCHIRNLSPDELVKKKEERHEMGGYFICNGIERIIRLLILPRRNHVMAFKRNTFTNRGPTFSDKACVIRCVRPDQTSVTIRLYALLDGNATLAFSFRRQEFFIPVGIILKCLVEATDREVYERLVGNMGRGKGVGTPPAVADGAGAGGGGSSSSSGGGRSWSLGSHFLPARAELLLREVQSLRLSTRTDCLSYIGSKFRVIMDLPARRSDAWVGQKVLSQFVFVHLDKNMDKFNLLIFMLHKLYALVDGLITEDNADCLQQHEILMPGHLLTMAVKERLQEFLRKIKETVAKDCKERPAQANLMDVEYMRKALGRSALDVGQRIEAFLNTGNLASQSGLDLQQASGFTLVAEKLNYFRYISHFRSVHRGAFFAQLRTTAVRKLLPESWGFMCPVHTPDGSPCGLLNHLTIACGVTTDVDAGGREKDMMLIHRSIAGELVRMGMTPALPAVASPLPAPAFLPVFVDGRLAGHLPAQHAQPAVAHLRSCKVDTHSKIPADLEVGYVPPSEGGAYPGLFLFSTPARMMRPVRQLLHSQVQQGGRRPRAGAVELIGTFEQAYMEIRCLDGSDRDGRMADDEERGGGA